MLPTENEVNYRGRKASRTGSERRRKSILEAALRIIIRDGVRGVKHRAVAKEAEVPLSATTYYFKDISDLITDTFTLFAEKRMAEDVSPLADRIAGYLRQHDSEKMISEGAQDELVADLAYLVAKHLFAELEDRCGYVLAEQAFLHEAIKDKRLQPLALKYRHHLEQGLSQLVNIFGSTDTSLDSKLLLTSMLYLQYEALISSGGADLDKLNKAVLHLFFLFLTTQRSGQSTLKF